MELEQLELAVQRDPATGTYHSETRCGDLGWDSELETVTTDVRGAAAKACHCLRGPRDLLDAMKRTRGDHDEVVILEADESLRHDTSPVRTAVRRLLETYPHAMLTDLPKATTMTIVPGEIGNVLEAYAKKTHTPDRWRYRAHPIPSGNPAEAETALRLWRDSSQDPDSDLADIDEAIEAAAMIHAS